MATLNDIVQEVLRMEETDNEFGVVYAKRIDGEFTKDSEAVLLQLSEDESDLPTDEIAQLKCPGYDYFLEVDLIHEVNNPELDLPDQVKGVIYYGNNDAYYFE